MTQWSDIPCQGVSDKGSLSLSSSPFLYGYVESWFASFVFLCSSVPVTLLFNPSLLFISLLYSVSFLLPFQLHTPLNKARPASPLDKESIAPTLALRM